MLSSRTSSTANASLGPSFDSEPTEEELVDYALGLDDKLAVLCESFGVRLVQDARGKWTVIVNDAKGEKW